MRNKRSRTYNYKSKVVDIRKNIGAINESWASEFTKFKIWLDKFQGRSRMRSITIKK